MSLQIMLLPIQIAKVNFVHAGPTIEDWILFYKSDLILLHNCTSHVPFYDLTN